jgi:hypothetical protein
LFGNSRKHIFEGVRQSRVKRRQAPKKPARERAMKGSSAAAAAAKKPGVPLPVDRSKIVSRSALPRIPDFYRDKWFKCKDCGQEEVWTAKQQKWWHEEQGGEIETTAIRCRACRRKERERREHVRKAHLEGIVRKRAPSERIPKI